MASSKHVMPRVTSPSATPASPWQRSPSASRSRSPQRDAISTMRSAISRDCSASPAFATSQERGDEQEARRRTLAGDGRHRPRRPGEPPTGQACPRRSSISPAQKAHLPAASYTAAVLDVRTLPGGASRRRVRRGGRRRPRPMSSAARCSASLETDVGVTPRPALERLAARSRGPRRHSRRPRRDAPSGLGRPRTVFRAQGPRAPPGVDADRRRAGRRSIEAAVRVPRSRQPAVARSAGERADGRPA